MTLYRVVGLLALLVFVAVVLLSLGLAFPNIGRELRQLIDSLRDLGQALR